MSRPWGRPGAPSQQINPNIFSNQLGLGGQFAGVPAMSLATNLNALVNQAAFSNMNMLAAAQAQQARAQLLPQVAAAQQQTRRSNSPPPGRTQRTFVGVVTKLMETYGFVDEDVFFQTNVIRGNMPRVGDRVMVEASYNASMPFKWNAYRIQLLPNENVPQMQQHSAPSQQIQRPHNGPEARWSGSSQVDRIRDRSPRDRLPPRRASPPRRSPRRSRTPPRRSPRRASPYRKASPPRRVEAHVKRERERTPLREKRESSIRTRSPTGSIARRETASPPRRRQRIVPRYQCYIPKPVVISAPLKYAELHQRYTKLYIPSDFVTCEFSWLNSFPLDTPFTLSPSPITFHVVNKDVDVLLAEGETLPSELPADADSRYSVRVLMLAHPGVSVVRQKVYGLLPDGSIDESTETQPITRALQFLVGSKGKFEVMGIGGPWSPSLDGENPADPQTLINTAIRTTRAMTGLDLSSCPRWYKMVHLKYYRPERNRLDSVVLMMPDLNATPGLMPSPDEYKAIEERLQKQLAEKLATIDAEQYVPPEKPAVVDSAKKEESVPESAPDSAKPSDDATTKPQEPTPPTVDVVAKEEPAAVVPVSEEKSAENGEAESAKAKKSWSELQETIKTLKVAELREELEARGLDSKGVKNSLIQRLQEAIDKEKAADESTEKPVETEPAETESAEKMETEEAIEPEKLEEVIDAEELVEKKDDEKEEKEEEKPAISEKELEELKKATEKFEKLKKERKAALERHYSFPKEPARLIFPSKTAKNGKFECKVASIQSLLDYRLEDNKEASFEAFLFAESFREMLDRTNAFAVYYNLNCALDREAERKRRDEALTATEEAQVKADEAVKTDTTDKEKETKEVQPKQKEAPKEDPRSKFKGLVNNVNAFTAFAHFDQNIVGHLMDHDLEQLIHSIGLDISRGDIHRLIKKFSAHDQVSYRNFTDKWVDKDGNVKYEAVPRQDAPTMAELIAGHVDESVSTQKEAVPILGSTPDITDTGIVFYKGTVLNVNHVLEQQRKIEVERETALLKVEELDGQLKTTKEDRDRLEKKRKNLTADVDYYKKKLYDTEKCLKKSDDDTVKMKTTLQDCKKLGEKIMLIVDKVMPTKKKEEVNKETEKSKTSTVAADDSQTASTNGVENSAAGADENSANNQELLVADEANENGNVSHKEAMDTSDVKTEQADTKEPEETSTA